MLPKVLEIGLFFTEEVLTRNNHELTGCKFHPSLLAPLKEMGVSYDRLTEVPLDFAYKQTFNGKSAHSWWSEMSGFVERYDYPSSKKSVPTTSMGMFCYEQLPLSADGFFHYETFCIALRGFFFFPMYIFPINKIKEGYEAFCQENPGVSFDKKVPTPHNCSAISVFPPPTHSVCAWSIDILDRIR